MSHARARHARAARALPPTRGHVHSTGRAVHAGRAARHMLPGHGQGCAALHEHPVRAGGCHVSLSVLLSAAPCAPARCLPPTPSARAHTHAHTRAHAHAHGAQAFACRCKAQPRAYGYPPVRLRTAQNRSFVLLDPIQRAIPPSPRPPPPPLARHTRACSCAPSARVSPPAPRRRTLSDVPPRQPYARKPILNATLILTCRCTAGAAHVWAPSSSGYWRGRARCRLRPPPPARARPRRTLSAGGRHRAASRRGAGCMLTETSVKLDRF